MAFRALQRTSLVLGVAGAVACSDSVAPATPDPTRTVLFYSIEAGTNFLLNTDGSDLHAAHLTPQDVYAPIAVASGATVVATLAPGAILSSSLTSPGKSDTMISPLPADALQQSSISLGAFSPDAHSFAVVSFATGEMLLLYDRVNHRLDTIPVDGANTAMAPAFSPDGRRIALVGSNPLNLFVTVINLDQPGTVGTVRLGTSQFTHRPLFGWPVWTSEGVLIAVVHVSSTGPDTVLSASFDPDKPQNDLVERYRAVLAPVSDERPEVVFGERSTFSYGLNGEGLALAAQPGTDPSRQAIYYASRAVGRIRLVLDDPKTFPEFPLVIN
jgi:hypothetical protein